MPLTRSPDETIDDGAVAGVHAGGAAEPGLLLVFTGERPALAALRIGPGQLVLGRGEVAGVQLGDASMSRQHARVRCLGGRLELFDLGSRNGSHIDGVRAPAQQWVPITAVARVGHSLFLPCPDVRPYLCAGVVRRDDGRWMGPASLAALAAIQRAARHASTLHLHGESGVGKEGAARDFHLAGPRPHGPFVAVNCATIPEGIAERLLFGARKGAFSGATADTDGYVQAASGGTLFLDEFAELELPVQAKLLRVLESREVLPLGATRPQPVDLRVCTATHRDLRERVAAGKLREDLYFRLGRPEVRLPPLRARKEELPWLAQAVLAREGKLAATFALVEACLLRPWPGNVRELLVEIQLAAHEALAAASERVEVAHLGDHAGREFTAPPSATATPAPALRLPADPKSPAARPVLEASLRRADGNVSQAARDLGLHRTQLRRLLEFHGIAAAVDP